MRFGKRPLDPGPARAKLEDMRLSQHETDSLRKALESKRAELLRTFGESLAAGTRSEEEIFPDPMDAATRAEEENEQLSRANLARGLLAEIDQALAKIAAGTYGVSELSGLEIPIERLRAVPWARLTADEEERREIEMGAR
jgi:DnaK suppressor protein